MRVAWALVVLVACGGGSVGGGTGIDAKGSGSAMPDAAMNTGALATCVTESNRYRAMASKPALVESATIEAYAATGAMDDFNTSPHHHFMTTSGGGIAFAENECPQQLGWTISPGESEDTVVAQCIAAFYSEGPGGGHYENLMGAYGSLGCGIYASGGKITILQDFGQ